MATCHAEEVKSHLEYGTWEIVSRPQDRPIIDSKIVLKNKLNPDGSVERRKARIVARGFTQRPGFDFNETFALVVRLKSVRLMIALAAGLGVKIHQLDVTTAYLNSKIDEELYMELPEMSRQAIKEIVKTERRDSIIYKRASEILETIKNGDVVCRLKKAIYSLKQSGRLWYEKLVKILEQSGFKPTASNPCMFQARKNDKFILITVYVDDMLIFSNDEKGLEHAKRGIMKELKIKDLGEAKFCLGIEIEQDENIIIKQRKYILEILERFEMSDCNPQKTLSSPGVKHIVSPTEIHEQTRDKRPYRELIGSLMYLAVATRPDIAHMVSVLAQFNENSSDKHWGASKRILKYVKGTADYGLVYKSPLETMKGYVNADWANDPNSRKSYTRYVFLLGGAAIRRRRNKGQ